MTRSKIRVAYISNDSNRRASYRKRKRGLIKKVAELSALCDVEACAIIYGPYDQKPEVWPSRAGAVAVLERYRSLSDVDQSRKMVNLESFTRLRAKKAEEQLGRLRRENDRRELEGFMFKCISGHANWNDFDLPDMTQMSLVVDQTLRDIKSAEARVPTAEEKGQGCMDADLLNYICSDVEPHNWGLGLGLGLGLGPQTYVYYNGNQNGAPGPNNFNI